MKIDSIVLNFTQEEALALRDLINGFFDYQSQLGYGEGSARTALAAELLDVLPQRPKPEYGLKSVADSGNDEIPF